MSTLIQIAIAVAAVAALIWFLRKMFRKPPSDDEPSDYAEVTAPVPRGPHRRTTSAKLDEPDDEP